MAKKRKRMASDKLYDAVASGSKKYARYDEAAELYSVGLNTMKKWARDAGAVNKVSGVALVNLKKLDEFIGSFEEV